MTSISASSTDSGASRYEWAEHLLSMEGGDPVPEKKPEWPGILLVCIVAVAAFGISSLAVRSGWSHARLLDPVLTSMILGMLVGNLFGGKIFLEGMKFAVHKLLPAGVVLLGARMNFLEALKIGLPGFLLSVCVVTMAIGLIYGLRRQLGLERAFACLLGVGTGICGGTAIVAVAPLVNARERDVMLGVGLVTLAGLVGMLVLPVLGGLLHLSQQQFGMLAGLTIHQTPQAIAAGFAYGDEAGQTATIAKLARVCLLAPVAALIGWLAARADLPAGKTAKKWYQFLPGFALGFLLMAGARSLGLLPEISLRWEISDTPLNVDTATFLKQVSGFLLATAMVGVGFQTRFSQLRDIGLRPFLVAGGASLIISIVVLIAVKLVIP